MGKLKKRLRKGFTGLLAACVALTSVNMTAWAAEPEERLETVTKAVFRFNGEELKEAALEAIRQGLLEGADGQREERNWYADSNAKLSDRYDEILNRDHVYEVSPVLADEDEGIPEEAEVRIFVHAGKYDGDPGEYQLRGDEKLVFLFANGTDFDLTFQAEVDGRLTPEVSVVSQERILDEEELEEDEIEVKEDPATDSNASRDETITDGSNEAETPSQPDGETGEGSSGDEDESEKEEESTEPGNSLKPDETSEPEKDTKEDTKEDEILKPEEEPEEDVSEEKELEPGTEVVSMSGHVVPRVAVSLEEALEEDGSEDDSETESLDGALLSEDQLKLQDDGADADKPALKSDKLEGTVLGTVTSDDGYRARAFVTSMKQIDGRNFTSGKDRAAYSLMVRHGLLIDNIYYYENQELNLNDEDFDEDGIYDYSGVVFTDKAGIMLSEAQQAMTANLESLKEEPHQELAIEYKLMDGYQVVEEETVQNITAVLKMQKSAASADGVIEKEGFPKAVKAAEQIIQVEAGKHYIITADPNAGAESDQEVMIPVSGESSSIAFHGGTAGNGSRVTVRADVSNLILNLASGGSDEKLILDAGNTQYAGLKVEAGASVRLTLVGKTEIYGGNEHAGIELNDKEKVIESYDDMAAIIIDGNGSLKVQGGSRAAGIGGGYMAPNGNLTVESGTVTAKGGEYGAGIGGGGGRGVSDGSYKNAVRSGGIIELSGGSISASGGSGGAGIGGGDHGDGGVITINEPAVLEAQGGSGGAGIGSGLGSHEQDADGKKGPGYYHGGKITINGGTITARGGWNAAGIGGGYCADSGDITIYGGTVKAYGDVGNSGSHYQGGAGIGGGYEGHGNVRIEGGVIHAYTEGREVGGSFTNSSAAGIGSGATPNSNDDRNGSHQGSKGRGPEAAYQQTTVEIAGGVIISTGGQSGGAGIGSGFGADRCEVNISGGEITAGGGKSSREDMIGGAGIGSGCYTTSMKYHSTTEVNVEISGGTILATGGWGASGIGSGAGNTRAEDIVIGDMADVVARADGIKFAVDTYDRQMDADNAFVTRSGARILQGTFMDLGYTADVNYEGLAVSIFEDRKPDSGESQIVSSTVPERAEPVQLPEGYRSFAASVRPQTPYLVKAEKGGFESRYFVFDRQGARENEPAENGSATYHYAAGDTDVSDNYWLYLNQEDVKADEEDPGSNPKPTPPPVPKPTPSPSPNPGGSSDSGGNEVTAAGSRTSGTPGDVVIADQPVPLAVIPPDSKTSLEIIEDVDVPLAPLPKTGEQTSPFGWMLMIGSLLMTVYWMMDKKKKEQ